MMSTRECIFCRHTFEPVPGVDNECPGCGTELPDESYAVQANYDEDQATSVSFISSKGNGKNWPAPGDPNVATLSNNPQDLGVNALKTQPDLDIGLMDVATNALDSKLTNQQLNSTSTSLPAFGDEDDIETDTAQLSAFEDDTASLSSMDLDALAAAVPETNGHGWKCPKCNSVWSATATPGQCPACDGDI